MAKIINFICFLIIGKVVLNICDIILNNNIYWNVFAKLRLKLVNALIDMDYADILKKDIGELTQTVENDSEQLIQFYLVFLTTLIKNILFVAGVIIVGLSTNVWIGLLLFLVICILFILFKYINKVAQKKWETTKNEYQKLFSLFSKINLMMDEMIDLNKEDYLMGILMKKIKSVFSADLMSSLVSYDLWISTILGFGIVKVFVLLFGVLMDLNLGVIYLFIYYIDLLNDPIEELRIQLENIPSTLESSKRVNSLTEVKRSMIYGDSLLEEHIVKVEFKNISFAYVSVKVLVSSIISKIVLKYPSKAI